jgi:hypothetical protein
MVGALLVVLATAVPAHARTEVIGGGPSHRGVSRPPTQSAALPDDSSQGAEKTEPAAPPGGAIYLPFAEASGSASPHATTAKPSSNTEHTGVGLAAAIALAGVALFGYILRRVARAK